jgi:hypothetical protein
VWIREEEEEEEVEAEQLRVNKSAHLPINGQDKMDGKKMERSSVSQLDKAFS